MSAVEPLPPPVPKPPSALIGRDEEFAQIVRFLQGEGGDTLVVCGMPGVGKSFLVQHAVWATKTDPSWILADAADGVFSTFQAQMRATASAVSNVQQAAQRALDGNKVLIFENADGPDVLTELAKLETWLRGVRRVVVTRNPLYALVSRRVQVNPLDEAAARTMMRRELGRRHHNGQRSETSKTSAPMLLQTLDGLPLAITLAAQHLVMGTYADVGALVQHLKRGGDLDALDPRQAVELAYRRPWTSLHAAFRHAEGIAGQLGLSQIDLSWLTLTPRHTFTHALADEIITARGFYKSDSNRCIQAGRQAGLILSTSPSRLGRERFRLHPLVASYSQHEQGVPLHVQPDLYRWFESRLPRAPTETGSSWAELDDERENLLALLQESPADLRVRWLLLGSDYALSRADLTGVWRDLALPVLKSPELSEENRGALRGLVLRLGATDDAPPASMHVDVARHRQMAQSLRELGLEEEARKVEARLAEAVPAASVVHSQEPVYFTTLRLTDWRGIRNFELDLNVPRGLERGQWAILVGENGSGKTSLLRAIALALVADEVGETLLGLAGPGAPHVRLDATRARVELELQRGWLPATEVLSQPTGEVLPPRTGNGQPRPFVVAYGCRRGSSLGGAPREVVFRPVDAVRTLFEEGAALIHAETWLRRWALASAQRPGTEDARFYDALLLTLQSLLSVEQIQVTPEQVWVSGPDVGRVPLTVLSDGYLTTLGWVLDLIARWSEHGRISKIPVDSDFCAHMCGVALVDDVDLYLHPRWQRRVLTQLRDAFPRMSFVVTTHNPITLLGAHPGEITVLRRGATGEVVPTQRDLAPGTSVDQVLTGEIFGLESTLDQGTLDLLLERQRLLLIDPRSAEEEARLVDLGDLLLPRLGTRGDTSLERLGETAVAQVLAEGQGQEGVRSPMNPEQRTQIKDRAKALVRKRLASTERREPGPG